jgi:hypothetical protein
MRVYEGTPRRDYEEVLRCIGGDLDQRRMREVLVVEVPEGFIVEGVVTKHDGDVWTDAAGHETKETIAFGDDEIGVFLDLAVAKRRRDGSSGPVAGRIEAAFRVLGAYIDSVRPLDILFFEQEGSYVMRTLAMTPTGLRHSLAEFTRDDVDGLIQAGPLGRGRRREMIENP